MAAALDDEDGSLETLTVEGSGEAWTAILHFEHRHSLSLGVRPLLPGPRGWPGSPDGGE